jgi:hypothetical protein
VLSGTRPEVPEVPVAPEVPDVPLSPDDPEVPEVTPVVAKSILNVPELTIGDPETVNLVFETGTKPTLVTVPPVPLPLAEDDIVTCPLLALNTILVPATRLVTPVFVTVTIPELAFALIPIPFPAVKVLNGLEQLDNVVKLLLILVKAVYNESLPVDSFCKPTFIVCIPEIAIKISLSCIYQKRLNELPHPQVDVAIGLFILNSDPYKSSW